MPGKSRLTLFLVSMASLASLAPAAADETPSPYAGQESCEIKSLSERQLTGYREGQGMGYAKAAELNHYPGPRHVLDLADRLDLDTDQAERVEAIFEEMNSSAVSLGKEIVSQEAELNSLFAAGSIDVKTLGTLLSQIAELEGRLRFVHLAAHLKTRAVLSDRQVQQYDTLRGYGDSHGAEHQIHH